MLSSRKGYLGPCFSWPLPSTHYTPRRWTEADSRRVIEDYALAGLNTIQTDESRPDDLTYQFIRSLGLKTRVHYGPNTGSGPPEW